MLFPFAPAGLDVEEYLEVHARHRTREHRLVLLVQQILDRKFHREVRPTEREELFQRSVAHVVGGDARDIREFVVVRGGEPFAVIAPFIDQTPRFVGEPAGEPTRSTRGCKPTVSRPSGRFRSTARRG